MAPPQTADRRAESPPHRPSPGARGRRAPAPAACVAVDGPPPLRVPWDPCSGAPIPVRLRSRTMGDVTQILHAIAGGDPHSAEELLPLVYAELRKLAASRLDHERPGQTLQPTALVHEAYLRLVDVEQAQHWNGRGHFFAAAAEAMRRILVERARRKSRLRHGGACRRRGIELEELATEMPSEDVVALDEALEQLRAEDPMKARLVTMRYFGGMTAEQAAAVLGISRVTATRSWTYARAWLRLRISDPRSGAQERSSSPSG